MKLSPRAPSTSKSRVDGVGMAEYLGQYRAGGEVNARGEGRGARRRSRRAGQVPPARDRRAAARSAPSCPRARRAGR
ncbi:MAG: hypothetical protein MZW92_80335 [Comamonadaceae bacterium]|nr:hypothetical protein [Comamonadaceae bacterium]